jgi:hypothetical protein
MSKVPVTLETVDVKSWSELFARPPAEILQRLDKGPGVPVNEGDAFLAVLVLRSVTDPGDASKHLEKATTRLFWLTAALVIVTAIAVGVFLV